MAKAKRKNGKVYLGIDIGGTKILAALARPSGKIIARRRCATPRNAPPEEVLQAVVKLVGELLDSAKVRRKSLQGIGLAVPGIVDPHEGRVVITPNMNLSGFDIVPPMEQEFRVPVALGNDVNLGTLGEQWLGNAALADSAVGIFVGTGIGGGIIIDGRLVTGHRGAAAEVGHLRMEKNGPRCGCGSLGCLEALASRTAIERDIRQAVANGRQTVLTEFCQGDLSVIRSSVLKRALLEGDALVQEVMTAAAQTLGEACLQIRHLLDPEVIVLGGGVVEACKFYILPVVQKLLASDPFSSVRAGGKVVISSLGDDAVVLGAVALAQQEIGRDPFTRSRRTLQQYPVIAEISAESITIGGRTYEEDVYIRVDGKVGRRAKARKHSVGSTHQIDVDELRRVCRGKPSILIIGTGHCGTATLTEEAEQFLFRRGITFETLSSAEAVKTYNAIKGRKAALIHLAC